MDGQGKKQQAKRRWQELGILRVGISQKAPAECPDNQANEPL
jgi:hypothetical protein